MAGKPQVAVELASASRSAMVAGVLSSSQIVERPFLVDDAAGKEPIPVRAFQR